MKVLLPAILLLEAVVVGLAIPVAVTVGGGGARAAWLLGALAVLMVVGSGLVRKPRWLWLGWALQVGLVLTGLLVPAMGLLGMVFLGLWTVGVVYGARGDALAARNRAAEAAWQREQEAAAGDPDGGTGAAG